LGPRRTSVALAVLALGSLLATAGAAAANSGSTWSSRASAPPASATGVPLGTYGHGANGGVGVHWENTPQGFALAESDGNSGTSGGSGSGTFTGPSFGTSGGSGAGAFGAASAGTSVGTSPAPVEAPAAAVSGPAPDAAAAAPVALPNFDALVAVVSPPAPNDGTRPVVTDSPAPQPLAAALVAPEPTPSPVEPPAPTPAPGVNVGALAGLPELGSIGAVASGVPDGPAAARALLSTGTGRSVAMIVALMLAVLLFLAIHRRMDRSDSKLTAAGNGPDVARFR
jgi:hypothetical protein